MLNQAIEKLIDGITALAEKKCIRVLRYSRHDIRYVSVVAPVATRWGE